MTGAHKQWSITESSSVFPHGKQAAVEIEKTFVACKTIVSSDVRANSYE